MILLGELIRRTSITSGQLVIPLEDLDLDYSNLEEVFLETISIYQKYKPDFRREIFDITTDGIPLPDATRVISVRPNLSSFYEYVNPMSFKSYEFYDGMLKTLYNGSFSVEYLARYPISNLDVSYYPTEITESETDLKFKLKGSHKKGSLSISLLSNVPNLILREDLSGYKVIPSSFTFDIGTDILTISNVLGDKIQTGSKLRVKSSVSLPLPLINENVYYAIKISNTQIRLAENIDNAYAGIYIDLSGTSSGVLSIESVVDSPNIMLLGNFGYANLNLNTLECNLTLVGSYNAKVRVSFKSLYIGVDRIDIQKDNIFTDLFKAKLMQSVGLIKEILKQPDLPFDFTPDNIYNRGKEIEKETMELLYSQSDWYLFRS